jgi:putative ABC transport system permease protein
MKRRPSLAQRFHRLLLYLLPHEFRGDFGDAMAADFDERREAEGNAVALRRETGAILAAALREHAGIFWRDMVDAGRSMRRAPGFTALAVLMLALGTGANVAMFSVIDAVMLRSPFVDRDRMAYVKVPPSAATPSPADMPRTQTTAGGPPWTTIVPIDRFTAFEQSPGVFAAVGALGSRDHLMTRPGDPQRPDFECITAGMFGVFGTLPQHGRVFGPSEDRPGAPPTVVLSDRFARSLGDPARIVGTTLTLNQTPVMVIGVMPRGFSGIYTRQRTSGWLPARVTLKGGELEGCDLGSDVAMFVRVRKDLSLEEAEALAPGVRLTPVDELTYGNRRTSLFILTAAVACVLLIACINVGGLQLERALARRRELALRVALGASRARLVRHALTENLVLALAGAAAALGTTALLHGPFMSILPWNLPHLDEVAINGRAMLAAIAVASAAGLVAGLIPVVHSRRVDPARDLAGSTPSATQRHDWTRRALVIVEIAVSIVVLIAAGLMIQTFATLRPTRPGFDPQQKLITLAQQPAGGSVETAAQFFGRLVDRLRALPDVRGVETTSYVPMSGTFTPAGLEVEGKPVAAYASTVSDGYFELMKIPGLMGRSFTRGDTPASPRVAVVNQRLAMRLRPDGAVIGLRVRARTPTSPVGPGVRRGELTEWQIIGVVGNTRTVGRDIEPRPEIYMASAQVPLPAMHIVVQTPRWSDPAMAAEIRQAIRGLHAEMVVDSIDAMTAHLHRNVATQRFGAWLLGVFAGLAVLLAATGLMTTMGWWVRLRTREIGVRVALGASTGQVTRLVARQGMSIAAAGIAVGCIAAMWLMRYLEGWIYGVTPLDGATFGAAGLGLAIVAAVAITVPMRRATHLDPVVALRAE